MGLWFGAGSGRRKDPRQHYGVNGSARSAPPDPWPGHEARRLTSYAPDDSAAGSS